MFRLLNKNKELDMPRIQMLNDYSYSNNSNKKTVKNNKAIATVIVVRLKVLLLT